VEYLSMYLDVADSNLLPPGWSRNAQFSLAVVNQLDSKASLRKGTSCYLSPRLYTSDMVNTSFSAPSNSTAFWGSCMNVSVHSPSKREVGSDCL
jgi:hypothetical protein